MNTCKDCRWWKDQRVDIGDWRACTFPHARWPAAHGVSTLYASTDDAPVVTGPDFGCVNWEAREEMSCKP